MALPLIAIPCNLVSTDQFIVLFQWLSVTQLNSQLVCMAQMYLPLSFLIPTTSQLNVSLQQHRTCYPTPDSHYNIIFSLVCLVHSYPFLGICLNVNFLISIPFIRQTLVVCVHSQLQFWRFFHYTMTLSHYNCLHGHLNYLTSLD